jgi:4-diphosphocytidyl-2-C-methyl-D-erythritol kinase
VNPGKSGRLSAARSAGRAVPRTAGRAVPDPGNRALAQARAPAKINLVLEVVGRRRDGYHAIRSIMAPLAFGDWLSVRVASRGQDRLVVKGLDTGPLPDNLVLRALAVLREAAGRGWVAGQKAPASQLPPLVLALRKRIPVAAGLAGGSSDAAAAFELAASAWGMNLGPRQRRRLAAAVGSDVPFFTAGEWALVSGRGERVATLPPPTGGPLGVLLVVPPVELSTRAVFEAFDRLAAAGPSGGLRPSSGARKASATRSLAAALGRGLEAAELTELQPANDLWPAAAALLPGLGPLREGLADLLGRPVHLSGSGPSLFALYPSPRAALRAAGRVRAALRDGDLRPPGEGLSTGNAIQTIVIATHTMGGSP